MTKFDVETVNTASMAGRGRLMRYGAIEQPQKLPRINSTIPKVSPIMPKSIFSFHSMLLFINPKHIP